MLEVPYITIGELIIGEPVTMLTDYILAGIAAWYAWKLFEVREGGPRRHWGASFVFLALAFFAGGSAHGFIAYLGEYSFAWMLALSGTAVASCFQVVGTAGAVCSRGVRMTLTVFFALGVLIYTMVMLAQIPMPDGSRSDAFHWLILFYLPSVLTVGALGGWHGFKNGHESGRLIFAGVVVSLLAAGWQMSRIGLHTHFNHNDIFHVIQMLGLVLFGRGALKLSPRIDEPLAVKS